MIDPRRLALAGLLLAAAVGLGWLAAGGAEEPAAPDSAREPSAAPSPSPTPPEANDDAAPAAANIGGSRPPVERRSTPRPGGAQTPPAAVRVPAATPRPADEQDAAVAAAAAWVAAFADAAHPDRLAVLHAHSSPELAARLDPAELSAAHSGVRLTRAEVTATSPERVGVRVAFHTDDDAGEHALEVVVGWRDDQPLVEEVRL